MRELKNAKGQTMVEFALIIALFLAILFGIVEFGRAWYYSNHLGNSVRAAARYGAVFADSSSINPKYDVSSIQTETAAYAGAEITSFMNATWVAGTTSTPGKVGIIVGVFPNTSTTSRLPGTTAKQGDTLKVTATYNYQILTGTIIPFFSGTRPIARSASMPLE